MNRNQWWLITILAFAAGLALSNGLVRSQEGGAQANWEYKVVRPAGYRNFKLIESTLNEHADEGWEVADWEVDERAHVFLLRR
jgi:hypothetical protein